MPLPRSEILPSPDFSFDPQNHVAGLRPMRSESYRLENEAFGNKLVVHNYGHGGAGLSMNWGCAEEVVGRILATGYRPHADRVAVLGGGVMGLTAATLLTEAGFTVTVYAKAFSPNTTSDIAGGQWAPSFIEHAPTPRAKEQFEGILRTSFRAYEARIGKGFGVYRRDNYTERESPRFQRVPRDLIPDPEKLACLPFQKLNRPGFRYQTLLIEPPIFLRRLHGDLLNAGVKFVQREFQNADEVARLSEAAIINCTGLGSRQIWADPLLHPMRGQLAFLRPQPELEYLYSYIFYAFPRSDGVVIGGTMELFEENPNPVPDICREMIQKTRETFEGIVQPISSLPDWCSSNDNDHATSVEYYKYVTIDAASNGMRLSVLSSRNAVPQPH